MNKAPALLALVITLTGCAKAQLAAPVAAHPPPSAPALHRLRAEITALLDQPGHQRATWGIAIRSLRGSEPLFELNARTLLVPGSTMKLVTAAVAGAAVGWDYTFDTAVEAPGTVENGVLHGDLVVRGTGDPSPNGRGGADFTAALIDALRQKSIARVEGRIVGDDSLVDEPRPGLAWSWDDLGTVTGTVAGALNIAENTMRIVVKPASHESAPTAIELSSEAVDTSIINRSMTTVAGSARTLWAEQRPGDEGLTIAGTLAADAMPATLTIAVGNPTLWFARFVRARLAAAGIDVQGQAVDVDDLPQPPARGPVLLAYRSRPLADIVRPMLKDSINMYAEAVLWLATGRGGARSTAEAIGAENRQLRAWNVPDDAIRIADGSGLSRYNIITADALATLLAREYDSGGASPFMQALPVASVDGTLASRMKATPAAGNARAKSGTMTNVRSLAGYVTTRDSEPLAFAIVVNNFEGTGAAVIATIDQIVARLAGFSRQP